jgi:hypothetical protein
MLSPTRQFQREQKEIDEETVVTEKRGIATNLALPLEEVFSKKNRCLW